MFDREQALNIDVKFGCGSFWSGESFNVGPRWMQFVYRIQRFNGIEDVRVLLRSSAWSWPDV